MKCPMKFGGEKRVSCSCEREACAWWVTEGYDDGRCAMTAKVPRKLGDLIEATEVGLDIVLALSKTRK